jgi:hypothetical protein
MGTLLPVSMFGTGPLKGDVYAYSQSVTLLGLSPSPLSPLGLGTTELSTNDPKPNHACCQCHTGTVAVQGSPLRPQGTLLTQCGDFSVEPVVLPAGCPASACLHSHRGHRALDHQLGGDTIYSHSELLALDSAGPGPCSRLLLEIRSRVVGHAITLVLYVYIATQFACLCARASRAVQHAP